MAHISNTERIDSYLRGNMSKEEEKEFMLDCTINSDLQQQLSITGMLNQLFQ